MGMPAHFQGILKLIVIAKIHFTQTGKNCEGKREKCNHHQMRKLNCNHQQQQNVI